MPASSLWNGIIKGSDFVGCVTANYEEVVHWRRNFYGLFWEGWQGICAGVVTFVLEKTALDCITLKAVLLQKLYPTASYKYFINCLWHWLPL